MTIEARDQRASKRAKAKETEQKAASKAKAKKH